MSGSGEAGVQKGHISLPLPGTEMLANSLPVYGGDRGGHIEKERSVLKDNWPLSVLGNKRNTTGILVMG